MTEGRTGRLAQGLFYALLGVWIFATGFFYLLRFSFEFYRANAGAIEALWRGGPK